MTYLDPQIWGPHYWFFLHTLSMTYPNHPNTITKKKYYEFIQNLPLFIPVEGMSKEFEKMILKNDALKCFFVSNPDSPYFQSEIFNGILQFLQKETNKAKLKQVGKNGILVVEEVENMTSLFKFLHRMKSFIDKKI
jgi:hypothetical protein